MVTALARLEGRAVGIVANNPMHQAGAIDGANADKAARFLQLCEAFGLPVVSLVDTPGFMVGPEAEQTALVRHVSRMFVVGSSLTVPLLRRHSAQGLRVGCAGDDRAATSAAPSSPWPGPPASWAAWGSRAPCAWASDESSTPSRTRESGRRRSRPWSSAPTSTARRCNVAAHFEIDDVIDPALTRSRIVHALASAAGDGRGGGSRSGAAAWGRRPFVDTW